MTKNSREYGVAKKRIAYIKSQIGKIEALGERDRERRSAELCMLHREHEQLWHEISEYERANHRRVKVACGWPTDGTTVQVGRPLWAMRTHADFSQQIVADALEVDQSIISRHERNVEYSEHSNGVDRPPDVAILRSIAAVCGFEFMPVFVPQTGYNRAGCMARIALEGTITKFRENDWEDTLKSFLARARILLGADSIVCYLQGRKAHAFNLYFHNGVRSPHLVASNCSAPSSPLPCKLYCRGSGFLKVDAIPEMKESRFAKAENVKYMYFTRFRSRSANGIVMINWCDARPKPTPEFSKELDKLSDIMEFVLDGMVAPAWHETAFTDESDYLTQKLNDLTSTIELPFGSVISYHRVETDDWLVMTAAMPLCPDSQKRIYGMDPTKSIIAHAYRHAKQDANRPPVYANDLTEDKWRKLYLPLEPNLAFGHMLSELVVPVTTSSNSLVGMLNIEVPCKNAFTLEAIDSVRAAADSLGVELDDKNFRVRRLAREWDRKRRQPVE